MEFTKFNVGAIDSGVRTKKQSSTYLPKKNGLNGDDISLEMTVSITMSARMPDKGEPMASPLFCLKMELLPSRLLAWMKLLFKTNLRPSNNKGLDKRVRGASSDHIDDIVSSDSCIGIDVKRETTSKETITWLDGISRSLTLAAKSKEFLIEDG